ncbi:MAG: lysophospholipase [Candidatus Thorarchaeota archaeon]|nr:MAG: lysophospholipase [Candidatus Thorarchaeota archaeon]
MEPEETTYLGHDDTEMLMRVWRPETSNPKAIVVGIHGLGSHSGLLSFVAEAFATNGYVFYAPDLRGFGTFPGRKGHVDSFDEYVNDMHRLLGYVQTLEETSSTVLYGHSLGGLHILHYVTRHPDMVDAIVTPCPAVSDRLKIGRGTLILASLLSRLNVKTVFDNGLDKQLISRNEEVVKRNMEDPLRYDKATPRMATEGFKVQDEVFNSGHLITVPVLMQQSGDDLILVPEKNKEFFDTVASEDKTWKLYEGLYHEPFQEPGGEQVLADLFAWLDERFPG